MGRYATEFSTGDFVEEPDFIKLYIKELCLVKKLPSSVHSMFNFMLANMNYNNVVSYGTVTKKAFLDDHNMALSTFNNYVSKLILSELIERIGKNEFRVNKKYAVKVEWSKVQSIQWDTKYSKNGKEEKVTFN